MFLHQANEWTIQSLVRRCWLNTLGATVNWFTGGIAFGHSVMAITGRRAPRVYRVKAGWSSLTLLPSRPQPRGQLLLARLSEHAAQLHDALGVIRHRHAAFGLFEFELDLLDGGGHGLRSQAAVGLIPMPTPEVP
jgi:hypothetical protein